MKIKTFKRYLKEDKEKYYTLDLYSDSTKDDVLVGLNELIPYILKMIKNGDVTITAEPVFEDSEQ